MAEPLRYVSGNGGPAAAPMVVFVATAVVGAMAFSSVLPGLAVIAAPPVAYCAYALIDKRRRRRTQQRLVGGVSVHGLVAAVRWRDRSDSGDPRWAVTV